MVLVQTWPFFQLFFQAIQARKMSLMIFQNEKTLFWAIKKKNPKSRKIYIFFKGVNTWFWSKNGHFSNFFLSNIRQKNVFYDIPERKNALLFYKNKESRNLKKLTFFKKRLTHGFFSKISHFCNIFQGNIGQKNVFYDILAKKKHLSRP